MYGNGIQNLIIENESDEKRETYKISKILYPVFVLCNKQCQNNKASIDNTRIAQ